VVVGERGRCERTSSLRVGKVEVVRKVTVVREVEERLRNWREEKIRPWNT
jgi:hypothetical protein